MANFPAEEEPYTGMVNQLDTGLSTSYTAEFFLTTNPIRMRGFDTNILINKTVYWNAPFIDNLASQYTGSAGPVIDVVYLK